MWNLNYYTLELIYETDSQTKRIDVWLPRERGVGRWSGIWGLANGDYYI